MSHTTDDIEDLPYDPANEDGGETEDSSGEEEIEEEIEEEEELSLYDSDTFISSPYQSEASTIPENILQFDFSYGYDCKKNYNLITADPDTIVFASGNLINFFDVETKTISFRRTALGGGIGSLKSNPNPEYNHLAIAENGAPPLIIVYEWPSLEINCVLKGGSSRLYSHLDYSPDGMLLASQGGEPDYLITIWNWPKRRILLRCKSYVNDINRVKFSPYVPGQLTTCGVSHIKFWKMANTFTGLKLQGEIGRFGKTEFSDILGVLPMPDEKVVSGCQWGNILVWDGGLIKLEVQRTGRNRCHEGPIVQFYFDEGELWTVSMDGHVKIWWYEKIDQADPPDEDRTIQTDPTYDFYTEGLQLMCLRKRYIDKMDFQFFGQDGNGGIWLIDLNTESTPEPSVQLYKCHAGKVMDLAPCPWGSYLATLGYDGRVYLYDYLEKVMIYHHQFPANGSCMLWLPLHISRSGDELIIGFNDGCLRLCILNNVKDRNKISLNLIQLVKPHSKAVTKISINPKGKILVSGGEDSTIFIFQIEQGSSTNLIPIGFIPVPNIVTCLTWHCTNIDEILVGCLHGEIVQIQVPSEPQPYTQVSYNLHTLTPKKNQFHSYKSQILRDIYLNKLAAKKQAKLEKKRAEMEKLLAENPGLDIDEDVFLADSDTEEELEPLYYPDVPNRVIWMQSIRDENTIWLSMGGYDAGYIYEYKIEQNNEEPYYFQYIYDGDDMEISCFVYNSNRKYLIFAMQNGEIRVNKLENGNFRNLEDYWKLPMHDNLNGFVPRMAFSYDERYFFTCGYDGNVFAYKFNPDLDQDFIPRQLIKKPRYRDKQPNYIEDGPNYATLSIEQKSLKMEEDRIAKLANAHKEALREKLAVLGEKFYQILVQNQKLPERQRLTQKELELDERITEYLDQGLQAELDLIKRKLAYNVEKSKVGMEKLKNFLTDPLEFFPIIVKGFNNPELMVKTLRQRRINQDHYAILDKVEAAILEENLRGRDSPEVCAEPPERAPPPPKPSVIKPVKRKQLEYFLLSLSPEVIEKFLGPKLTRLLKKYRHRKLKWEERQEKWEQFMARKPVSGINHPEDEEALLTAKLSIGDFKLKTADDYKVPREQRETTLKKYRQLLKIRCDAFNIRYVFNKKVYDLRAKKVQTRQELRQFHLKLDDIHTEIPADACLNGPSIEDEVEDEFPERHLEITVTLQFHEEEDIEQGVDEAEEVAEALPEDDADSKERQLLIELKPTRKKLPHPRSVCELSFEALTKISEHETEDNCWENEIRNARLRRKLYEQQQIIEKMERKTEDFNEQIRELAREIYQVQVDGEMKDLFILQLHQELLILKDFESLEDQLQETVNQQTTELLDMNDEIRNIEDQILNVSNGIESIQEDIRALQERFLKTVQDYKFMTFLQKVFKKKYRPPKIRIDDESSSESSSSSSSSSEEDDARSIDSRDFGIIKQDLNVCPKGCDPGIYDYTIQMRTQRHQLELKIKDDLKTIDQLKKDLDTYNRKIKVIQKTLNDRQMELEKYQRQKQNKLNQVRTVAVLRLNQLQHVTPENDTKDVMETLVFNKTLLSKLYKRVDQLDVESKQQSSKHSTNIKHLARMKADCKFMKYRIKSLKDEIVAFMKIKFGKEIDLNEIEEAMLKRTFGQDDLADLEEVLLKKLVRNLRMALIDIRGMYIDELQFWRDRIEQTKKELTETLSENTSRQELLMLLTKERMQLIKALEWQDRKQEHLVHVQENTEKYQSEIGKLDEIIKKQRSQLQELRDEIKMLKTKGLTVKAPRKSVGEEQHQEIEWDYEKFVGGETLVEEEERIPFSNDILQTISLTKESEILVASLVEEMFEALNIELSRRSTENFIRETISIIMQRFSVTEIAEDLIRNLPIEPDDDQQGIIEATAEQLYTIQGPEIAEEVVCAAGVIDDIIDEVILTQESPNEMISSFLLKLVDTLPLEFIKQRSSLELITEKLINSEINLELDRKELERLINNEQVQEILNEILEQVYAFGLDYLFIIK